MALGGTIIGTTNRGHFVAKIGAGDRAVVAAEVIEKAREGFERAERRMRSSSSVATAQ